MFTGIVEEVGTVKGVLSGSVDGEIRIGARKVLEGTKIGDSIAVNGVCLTVTKLMPDGFTANVMPETLRRTNLGTLTAGEKVDLERAMAADGRFGGHIVSGHIDGVGKIERIRSEGNAVWFTISAEAGIIGLIVEKGSIAIDGISLTVADVSKNEFRVSIIPHTSENTILLDKKEGDKVNLENDIVGKYVRRLMNPDVEEKNESRITLDFLSANGF
ncbi:MAG: riboflavin synthase [Lachnospiraceae bacterium]|jgi:riboflavin synthase